MKKNLLFALMIALHHLMYAQAGGWPWINGTNTTNSNGVYGTQGIPDSLNTPSALYEPCEWKDKQGFFWLYGGLSMGTDVCSNLWKFDAITNEWTWVKGPG